MTLSPRGCHSAAAFSVISFSSHLRSSAVQHTVEFACLQRISRRIERIPSFLRQCILPLHDGGNGGKGQLRICHQHAMAVYIVSNDEHLVRIVVTTALQYVSRSNHHTARTAARIINRALKRLYHFGDQIDNAFRSIELSLALAFRKIHFL